MSEEYHSRSSSSGSRASTGSANPASSAATSSPHSTLSEKSSSHTITAGDESSDFSPISSPRTRRISEASSALYTPKSQDDTSESLIADPETDFDKLLREYENKQIQLGNIKPQFVPVLYSADEPPQKFRRLCARAHELDLRQKLANSCLTDKEIDLYATNASFYPGSRYQSIDRALSFSMTPPRISFSSSEEGSPNFLFRDLPAKLSKRKYLEPPSPASSTQERSSSVLSPKTSNRRSLTDGYKTPARSSVDVDHLSPVFDRITVRRKRHIQNQSLESPVLPSSKTPENRPVATNVVPFIKAHSAENVLEPDQLIMSFRLKLHEAHKDLSTGLSRSCATLPEQQESSTESLSLSRLSSNKTISIRASSYQPSVPIVLLVPDSVFLKYFESLVQFITEFRVEVVTGKLEDRVTHVLLDEDIKLENDNIKVEYIQAIGFQMYLVYPSWITESISKGQLLDPANFEAILSSRSQVPPSRISRNSDIRLFREYAFLCAKPFGNKISRDQLVDLLTYNGGVIAFEPNDFADHHDKIRICIVGEFFNNEQNKQQLRHKLEKWNCVKVHYDWIFEVFATFSLQPMLGHLFDTTFDEARIAGVPEELLK